MSSSDNKLIWIKAGYEIFATAGQTALKVEPLAKSIHKMAEHIHNVGHVV